MYDFDNYEDQPTDELIYGRCQMCHQIEELNGDSLCLVCEGIDKVFPPPVKKHWMNAE